MDGVVCDATDLYAFVRRAALRTLAVVVNPKKRARVPTCAKPVASPPVLASDDYAEREGGKLVAARRSAAPPRDRRPASRRSGTPPRRTATRSRCSWRWRRSRTPGACRGSGAGILEDALRRLKGAKASFGAVVEGLRSGAMDHHGAREAFKRKLDGVVDDYVAGLGDAAPSSACPRARSSSPARGGARLAPRSSGEGDQLRICVSGRARRGATHRCRVRDVPPFGVGHRSDCY